MKSNRVNGNKNYIFIRLPKRSVAYSATAVETVFVDFLKFLLKQRKMSKLAFLSFVRILIFKFFRSSATVPKTCKDLIVYAKFMTLSPEEYYLIPGNDAKNLLKKIYNLYTYKKNCFVIELV